LNQDDLAIVGRLLAIAREHGALRVKVGDGVVEIIMGPKPPAAAAERSRSPEEQSALAEAQREWDEQMQFAATLGAPEGERPQ
jgi:hypothetical protein